jgi:SAM-dependent methyltransferase
VAATKSHRSTADRALRAHYEALPYPARDPADEATRLIAGSPSHLDEINHYVFAGRLDLGAPFRALIAGGGTGDGAIMLAQQLTDRNPAGQVIYLDQSGAAREVAEARAGLRGLANIEFHTGSLLDVDDMGLEPFDYIDCCGVLHHLADPAAGLKALSTVLSNRGGMGLMVYGALGRTGVYPMQAALAALTGDADPAEAIALARTLLGDLPETNWLRRNPHLSGLDGDDAALYDLLLHSRDRAYTVPEIAALADAAGLAITGFVEPARYDPASYLDDDGLRARAARLDWLAACALAENLAGNMKAHVFYVTKGRDRAAALARPGRETAPVLRDASPAELARAIAGRSTLSGELGGITLRFPLPANAAAIVERCDGTTRLGAIHRALAAEAAGRGSSWSEFRAEFDQLYAALGGLNLMLLRAPVRAGKERDRAAAGPDRSG